MPASATLFPNPGSVKPVVFIMGPTASGKTDLAIELVQHYPFEIISVDSALIYRQMDIGTAKPDAEALQRAPHHLIDFLDPAESYSVAGFRRDALAHIETIQRQGNIPLLVGGTMLYHRALLSGLSTLPTADAGIREELNQALQQHGNIYMHRRLQQIDPQSAARIHPNDPQRIQRALEVYLISGKTLTELQQQSPQTAFNYPYAKIIIAPSDRERLRERIALRFHNMLQQGFVAEVEQLRQRGDLNLNMPSMRCVGYRQVWEYLDGNMNEAQMIERAITVTRQFAKRQMTWLKKEQQALRLTTGDAENLEKALCYLKQCFS